MARRGLPEINAGSMADIAFLLLIFFLVTTTMDQDTGIARKLPPMPEENQETPPQLNNRNIYVVKCNSQFKEVVLTGFGRPTIETKIKTELKESAKDFITNNGKNPKSSESPEKAIISLQTDNNTEYKTYIRVQNELTAAYNEVRNEESIKKFSLPFNQLNKEDQKTIKKLYPQKISEAEPRTNNTNINE